MFNWGTDIKEVREIYPKAISFSNCLRLNNLQLENYPGDCGALILNGCNTAGQKEIDAAVQIASITGMSKLFGTIVLFDKNLAEKQKKIFVKAGFRVISHKMSNRNKKKTDIVVFYHNPNCLKKGY